MTRQQATDLAERLWGEQCAISYRHHTQFRKSPGRCRVGKFDGDEFLWLGQGGTWEKAFSQALSDTPLNERDNLMEIMFP